MPQTPSTEELRRLRIAAQRAIDIIRSWTYEHGGVTVEEPDDGTGSQRKDHLTPSPARTVRLYEGEILIQQVKPLVDELSRPAGESNPLVFPHYWLQLRSALRTFGRGAFVTQFERGNYGQFESADDDLLIFRVVTETVSKQLDIPVVQDMVWTRNGKCTAGLILDKLRKIVTGKPVGRQYYQRLFELPHLRSPHDSLVPYFKAIDIALLAVKWSGFSIPESELASILYEQLVHKEFGVYRTWILLYKGKVPVPEFSSVQEFKDSLEKYADLPQNADPTTVPEAWELGILVEPDCMRWRNMQAFKQREKEERD